MPSFLDTYRRDTRPALSSFRLGSEPPEDETPFERWQRENRERMEAAGALPTEAMPALPTEGNIGTFAARTGREALSGALGFGALATTFSPARLLPEVLLGQGNSPVGWLSEQLAEGAEHFQETPDPGWMPGEAAPRGPYSERFIDELVGRGAPPVAVAASDTVAAALGLADPTDLAPGGAAIGTLGTFLRRFLRRGADEAAPAAGRLVREAGEDLVDEFSSWRGVPETERSTPLGAMEHAGSGASPEAAARMQGGTRFYEVSPGGEVTPIIGQDAVDRPARRGRAKVRISPNGETVVEDGVLTEAGRRALEGVRAETPPVSRVDEPDIELDLDAGADDDFLRSMGVELPSGRALGEPIEVVRHGEGSGAVGTFYTRGFGGVYGGEPRITGTLSPRNPLVVEGTGATVNREALDLLTDGRYVEIREEMDEAFDRGTEAVQALLRSYGMPEDEVSRVRARPESFNAGYPMEALTHHLARERGYDAILHASPNSTEVVDLSGGRNFTPGPGLPSGRAQSLSDASAPPARPPGPRGSSDALEGRLPFQTNFRERLGLDQEAGDALEEILLKNLDSVQTQRRAGGPSLAEKKEAVERIAAANGMTPRKFMETKPGTVYNDDEMMVLDSMIARRGDDVRDLSRQLEAARQSNLGDVDRLQLEMGRAIYEQNALLKVSIGSSSEAGRALRSRQEIVRAIKKCFPMG